MKVFKPRNVIFNTVDSISKMPFPPNLSRIHIVDDYSNNLQSMKTIEKELKNIFLNSQKWEIM